MRKLQLLNNFQMQLGQLQAIIQECKEKIKQLEQHKAEEWRRKMEASQLKKIIRERRIEITQLQYEIKRIMIAKKEKQEVVKLNGILKKQLKNCLALNSRELISYEKLFNMVENMQEQVNTVDIKMINVKNEIQQSLRKKQKIKQKQQAEAIYNELKRQLKLLTAQLNTQSESFGGIYGENEEKVKSVSNQIEQIDIKYEQLCQKVEIQKEIIEKIKNQQLQYSRHQVQKGLKSKTETNQMVSSKSNFFKNKQQLDFLEKIEVQNILLRQQFKKEEQESIMSRMVNHKFENNLGRIINNRYRYNNYSDNRKTEQYESKTHSLNSHLNLALFNASDRLKNLQLKKRIRTRQSEMKRYSQKFRNLLLHQLEQKSKIEPLPQSNIVDVYTEMKNSNVKNRIGNIEVFKVAKSSNKKKYINSQRGGGLQFGEQYLK